jgi:CoA:oxalate CoA-transferase
LRRLQQPLEGIRVIDLTRYIAGPYCTAILADMGAEVIEIERPGGDDGRRRGVLYNGENIKWHVYHRNKKAITLNLRADEGKEILRDLVRRADVVVENYRPGTIDKMGFGLVALRELKPNIILVSISGFGQYGPFAQRPGFDAIAQALSGLMSLNGEPDGDPVVCGPSFLGDISAGTWAAMGAVLALFYREHTGIGQHADASLLESVMPFLMTTIPDYVATGVPPERLGNRDRYGVPANAFHTRDGMVYIDAGGENLFRRLCQIIGRPEVIEDPRFATYPERFKHREELEPIVAAWTRERSTQEVMEVLGSEVPSGPIRTVPEVVLCPQLAKRGYLVELDDPKLKGLPLPGVPIHLSESPGKVRRPAPTVGQHNEEVYCIMLGYAKERLDELHLAGVI